MANSLFEFEQELKKRMAIVIVNKRENRDIILRIFYICKLQYLYKINNFEFHVFCSIMDNFENLFRYKGISI